MYICEDERKALMTLFSKCSETRSHLQPLLHLEEETIPVARAERSVCGIFLFQGRSRVSQETSQEISSHVLNASVPVQLPPLYVRSGRQLLDNLHGVLLFFRSIDLVEEEEEEEEEVP